MGTNTLKDSGQNFKCAGAMLFSSSSSRKNRAKPNEQIQAKRKSFKLADGLAYLSITLLLISAGIDAFLTTCKTTHSHSWSHP